MSEPTKPKITENRVVLGIGVLASVILLLGSGWWLSRYNVPTVAVPPPVPLPSPNAYDYYIRAGKGIVDPVKVEHAFLFLQRLNPNIKPVSLAEQRALVKANGPVLATLRQGLPYEFRELANRSIETGFFRDEPIVALSRLLSVEASVRETQGDWSGAMQSALDIIQIGQELPHGGTLLSLITATSIQNSGQTAGEKIVAHLSPQKARAALKRLSKIIAKQVPYADVLQEEKYVGQTRLMEVFKKRSWREVMLRQRSRGGQDFRNALRLANTRPEAVLKNYTAYMDALIAQTQLPYSPALTPPLPPDDPVSEIVAPVFSWATSSNQQAAARNARLALELALQAYKEEKGYYPNALAALIPAYLEKLPDDPTMPQGTFGYRRDKDGKYTLVSQSGLLPPKNP